MNQVNQLQAMFAEAVRHFERGDLGGAEARCRSMLGLDPKAVPAIHLLGNVHLRKGEFPQAVQCFETLVALDPRVPEGHANLAMALERTGNLDRAAESWRAAIARRGDVADFHNGLGNVLLAAGRLAEAEAAFERAVRLNTAFVEFRINLAAAQARLGRLDKAEANTQDALRQAPGHLRALAVRAQVLHGLGRFEEAVACGQAAVRANPSIPAGHVNLAAALEGLKRFAEALACHEEAIRLAANYPDAWCGKGRMLARLERHGEAEAAFRQALALRPDFALAHSGLAEICAVLGREDDALAEHRRAVELAPGDANLHFAFGNWQQARRQFEAAAVSLARALDLRPDFAEAACHLGDVFHSLYRLKDAVTAYGRALSADPAMVKAMVGLGSVHLEAGRDDEAVAILSQAYQVSPSAPYALDMLVLARLQSCTWENADRDCAALLARIRDDEVIVNPFVAILAGADSEEQCLSARQWAKTVIPADAPLFRHAPAGRAGGRRLKIGYMSSDFHDHPLAHIMMGTFEHHDRERFELHAYSLGFDDGSAMRRRAVAAFEHFTEIGSLGSEEAARRIHADGIDVLVDLNGYTNHGNPTVLAYKPAPIQVNFQGYPATMGAGFMDYIIGDPVTLPQAEQPFFDERIVQLPHSYHPNAVTRAADERTPTRSECGLPEDGVVFCCFNNASKFTRSIFTVWMRVLLAVPGSVLWLQARNDVVKNNLRAEAAALGVDAARLVFAPRTPTLAEHLARHRLADLFLDTQPYNAHTTASDALWMGLPVLTCLGKAFAGRVAASLLTGAGLGELVTHSLEEYQALAITLAKDDALRTGYRAHLTERHSELPIFDTARFTRSVEAAYLRMWERWQAGEAPEPFAV